MPPNCPKPETVKPALKKDIDRVKGKLKAQALKRKEAEVARSVMDVENGQHDMAAAEGQGVPVT